MTPYITENKFVYHLNLPLLHHFKEQEVNLIKELMTMEKYYKNWSDHIYVTPIFHPRLCTRIQIRISSTPNSFHLWIHQHREEKELEFFNKKINKKLRKGVSLIFRCNFVYFLKPKTCELLYYLTGATRQHNKLTRKLNKKLKTSWEIEKSNLIYNQF